MNIENSQNLSLLMKLVQDGDHHAYKELFAQIGPVIIRIIRQRIKNENTVEDIYQTILMTIHRARHTFDPSRPFKPWMYSITRNTIFDYLRKNRKKIELETLIGDNIEVGSEQDTTTEEMQILKKALSALPKTQREAVELLKIKGLSLQEAADQTGVSVGAIKVRAHRGYESLKKLLIESSQEVS